MLSNKRNILHILYLMNLYYLSILLWQIQLKIYIRVLLHTLFSVANALYYLAKNPDKQHYLKKNSDM